MPEANSDRKKYPPWFKCFHERWTMDGFVRTLSLAEKGAYWELLFYQFREGKIPLELAHQKKILGAPRFFPSIWRRLRVKFPLNSEGDGLENPLMAEVRKEAFALWEQKKNAGKASARQRALERALQRPFQPSEKEEDDTRIPLSSSILDGVARAGARGKEKTRGIFSREKFWEKKEDAIASSRVACDVKKIRAFFRRAILVRNALDCWARRSSLKNPRATFHSRVKKGFSFLERFGQKYHEQALQIVRTWVENERGEGS